MNTSDLVPNRSIAEPVPCLRRVNPLEAMVVFTQGDPR